MPLTLVYTQAQNGAQELMNIIQLTPGAGAMFCGNCFRDNALVAAVRALGHDVTMVPLYLPLTLESEDQSAGTPIFFGGVNVYLDQKFAWFRTAPRWLHRLLACRPLLRWAAGRAATTRAASLGELTLSMLRGEAGNQAGELRELLNWLRQTEARPDIVCLSNALLLGMARQLKSELRVPIICGLQGEDSFLDALPDSHRDACWQLLAERAAELDAFVAPSRYFADLMSERLGLNAQRVHVIYNGIDLSGYRDGGPGALGGEPPKSGVPSNPVLGYFARMCREKGLDTLVEAFIRLRQKDRVKNLQLHVGGSCGPGDEEFVNSVRRRLQASQLSNDVQFHPNLSRADKLAFLRRLTVFSVPALYGEAFGLYVLEAMAAGLPVVQPRVAAFPELLEVTGGGVLCAPGDPAALADAIEGLLLDPQRLRDLGQAGARAVSEKFTAQSMARESLRLFEQLRSNPAPAPSPLKNASVT